MTVYAVVDGEECGQVATNKGWSDFSDWTETQQYFELAHLGYHGYSTKVSDLAEVIELAIEETNPPKDIVTVARGIAKIARAHPKAECLYVTDGTGAKKPKEDEEDVGDDE